MGHQGDVRKDQNLPTNWQGPGIAKYGQGLQLPPTLELELLRRCFRDGAITTEDEQEEMANFQQELFAPASIATDSLEKDYVMSSLLPEYAVYAGMMPIQLPLPVCYPVGPSDHTTVHSFTVLLTPLEVMRQRYLKIEKERLLRYLHETLIGKKSTSWVDAEVHVEVPQNPSEIVVEDDERFVVTHHTSSAEDYMNRIFEN